MKAGMNEEGRADAGDSTPRPKTASGNLLQKAAEQLGIEEIARAIDVPPDALARFLDGKRQMTLAQQRTLAMAVLLLSEGHADLRRRAKALLGQVHAALDFENGTTQRHADAPPRLGW